MRVKKLLLLSILLSVKITQAQTTDKQLERFWQISDYGIIAHTTPDLVKSIYFATAKKLYPDKEMSEILSKIENIRKDYALQDLLYLRFIRMYGTSQFLNAQMAEICGTYTLGNYVSNYIIKKYSKDKRYLQAKNQSREKVKDEVNNNDEQKMGIETVDSSVKDTIKEKVYTKVEREAYFPGGNDAYVKYLKNEIWKIKDSAFVQVVVSFTVTQDGSLDSIRLENPTHTAVDEKIIAIFKKSPKWIPAEQNGRKVMAFRKQLLTIGDPEW